MHLQPLGLQSLHRRGHRRSRIPVHRSVNQRYLVLTGPLLIGHIAKIVVHDLHRILAPHDPVPRSDNLDGQRRSFLNGLLGGHRKGRDDVGVVAHRLPLEKVNLLLGQLIVVGRRIIHRPEGAEGVAGHQRTGFRIESGDGFRPVHIGNLGEGQHPAVTQIQSIPVAHLDNILGNLVEPLHQGHRLLTRYHRKIRPNLLERLQPARMIGLHVVHDYVVDGFGIQFHLIELFEERFRHAVPAAHPVHDGGFLSLDDVGTHRNSVGNGPQTLEQNVVDIRRKAVNTVCHCRNVHNALLTGNLIR